ncbi:MAG: tRNA pseudouridine(55) synthase TruB [Solirubrobacterales bacterium]|nr:tRNA pseudouridine(55) synthase TruB [Solirubrobacterales bacterium]
MEPQILIADKPVGITSHDLVAATRRGLDRGVKVGHAGTLDPFASGLLIILIGAATRTQKFFMGLQKTYEVEARFGAVSSTGDPEGQITETGIVPQGDLDLPTGQVTQRPPAYSAVKIDGERAYKRARRGEEVVTDERVVTVDEFAELDRTDDIRRFRIRCSSGTYVRSLVSDLGDAYCTQLRRTAIGPFSVAEAEEGKPTDLLQALVRFMPTSEVTTEQAEDLRQGRSIVATIDQETILTANSRIVALARGTAEGRAEPFIVFPL